MFFTNNGTYFSPFGVSACYILPDTSITNGSPDVYINRTVSDIGTPAYGRLTEYALLSAVVATFDVSNGGKLLDELDYSPDTSAASGIYSGTNSKLTVIADGAAFPSFSSLGISDGKWFDVWLIKDFETVDASAGWQLYWNKFETYQDRIISFTEPFQITAKNNLTQKYIQLSSIETLRVTTDVFLANRNMTEDEKNVWRQSSLTNAEIKISKRNPNTTGLITQVIPWTSIGVEVTSNNTILFNWDTRSLSKGDYTVQVRYTLLEQTFVSEEFSLVLR
tara:strand:+ start:3071 stop:3904 length:834 start_codon:yes stop_codon:yes gene_type:complete